MSRIRSRRKGVGIIQDERGKKSYSLPGGGAKRGESRKNAMIREIMEETNLESFDPEYLGSYKGRVFRGYKGNEIQNHTKVFSAKSKGKIKKSFEIEDISFWAPGSLIHLSKGTKKILKKFGGIF